MQPPAWKTQTMLSEPALHVARVAEKGVPIKHVTNDVMVVFKSRPKGIILLYVSFGENSGSELLPPKTHYTDDQSLSNSSDGVACKLSFPKSTKPGADGTAT